VKECPRKGLALVPGLVLLISVLKILMIEKKVIVFP